MANFEAFCRTKKLISNLFFLKSVLLIASLWKNRVEKDKTNSQFPNVNVLVCEKGYSAEKLTGFKKYII